LSLEERFDRFKTLLWTVLCIQFFVIAAFGLILG
jgi:hypothetical protein